MLFSLKKAYLNIRHFEPKCLMFKTVSLDFSGFQGCQNAKTVDNTITPSKLIAHCPPSFRIFVATKPPVATGSWWPNPASQYRFNWDYFWCCQIKSIVLPLAHHQLWRNLLSFAKSQAYHQWLFFLVRWPVFYFSDCLLDYRIVPAKKTVSVFHNLLSICCFYFQWLFNFIPHI